MLAIAILKQVVACSKLQEEIRSRKLARKPRGGDGVPEPVRIPQYLIPMIQLLVYPMIGKQLSQFSSTLMSIIWFRAYRV